MNLKKISGHFTRSMVKIVIYVVLVLVLVVAGHTAYKYGQRVFSEKGIEDAPGKDIYVTVPQGASDGDVASLLESYGLVDDAFIFKLQLKIYGAKNIKPGEYTLNTSQSGEEMIHILTGNKEDNSETESNDSKNSSKKATQTEKSKEKK